MSVQMAYKRGFDCQINKNQKLEKPKLEIDMLLALETVHDSCSVCLYHDGVLASDTVHAPRKHTQLILPMIEKLLARQKITLADITAIAFNRGPGSFSGIRINTAVTQALAFAYDIACIPVSGLQAQAQAIVDAQNILDNAIDSNQLIIINDAKMKELFVASFTQNNGMITDSEEQLLSPTATTDFIAQKLETSTSVFLTGDALDLIEIPKDIQFIEPAPMTAEHIGKLGWHALHQGVTVNAAQAQPVYLRDKAWKTLAEQAEAKKKKQEGTQS